MPALQPGAEGTPRPGAGQDIFNCPGRLPEGGKAAVGRVTGGFRSRLAGARLPCRTRLDRWVSGAVGRKRLRPGAPDRMVSWSREPKGSGMARPTTACVLIAGAALVAGCFEGKADITLNPDGTGRIVGEITFQATGPWAVRSTSKPDLQPDDPETQMKEIVRTILKSSRGIEAWKDVSFKRLPDDRIEFKGTAYFEDISKVKIHPDDAKSRAAFGPEGDKALLLVLHRPGDGDTDRTSRRRYTAESLAARMKSMRRSFRETRGPIGLHLADMTLDLRFHVPGVPNEVKGLEQLGRALTFSTTGPHLIRHMDSLVADYAELRRMAMAGQSLSGRSLGKAISSKVFSQKGEVWAKMTGHFQPRFDYPTEVKAAEDGEKGMLVKLGLEEKRTSSSGKDTSKKTAPKKDAPPLPRLPFPKKPPSIPTPIFPF